MNFTPAAIQYSPRVGGTNSLIFSSTGCGSGFGEGGSVAPWTSGNWGSSESAGTSSARL